MTRAISTARAAARFLTRAWDAAAGAMPFEIEPARFTYFFDCGIVVRGLLAVWRATGDGDFLECARLVGDSMARDFAAPDGQFHPILTLPGKRPLERDALRWSQSPGCYQLKAGMAWWDLWEATGDACYAIYTSMLEDSLRTAPDFLPGHAERRKVVDRLHAYLYFLEGLLADAFRGNAAALESNALPEFCGNSRRSSSGRMYMRNCCACGCTPMRRAPRNWIARRPGGKAERLLEFAAAADDPRVDGGFYFGRTAGRWEPYINPVSTAFALQALALWSGAAPADRHLLI
jgi:hypothetical protein